MPDNTIRGRFAPSPSGRLHLGNMLTFLLAWLDVRARGGTMVFRLEDLDPERSWERYAELMADDLLWLGLDWDEGWRPGAQDSRQGTRTERYTAALDALTERGAANLHRDELDLLFFVYGLIHRSRARSQFQRPLDQIAPHLEAIVAKSPSLEVAAKTLGIDSSTLYRKRKQFGAT